MPNGNVYLLEKFIPDNPNDLRECAKGHWVRYAIVSNPELCDKWINLDKRNRRYEIIDLDEEDKGIEEETKTEREEL